MQTIIYGLDDPITQQLRYVGKTTSSLRVRLGSHISQARCHRENVYRYNWIRSLLKQDLRPGIKAEISATLMGHEVSEKSREKMRIAKLGGKHTPEHCAKISAGLKNSWASGTRTNHKHNEEGDK